MSRYQSKWIRTAFVFVSIIFFSSFLLLVSPSFGQEDKVCLLWGIHCVEWKEVEKKHCRRVVSPSRPNEEKCSTYYVRVCDKQGSYCRKWVSANPVDVGKIKIRRSQRAEAKDILAAALNRRLDRLGLGTTIENPILPSDVTIVGNRVTFHITINITIELVGRIRWCDPVIAVGYNYFIDHGPRAKDIELPEGIGDNRYNLWLFDPALNDFKDSGVELVGGEKYRFEEPVRKFSIRGIEVDAELDPKNQRAFPTGLAFDRTGKVSMRMVPITVDTDKQ
ncbi:hypothetical protein VU04_06550 [Desulfobulbus sp. TB]|nr:hypothetical protein [Desulfobulbus sp. TB]